MKRIHVDLDRVSHTNMKVLKEILWREYARQTLGPDTDPDLDFTGYRLSAQLITKERK